MSNTSGGTDTSKTQKVDVSVNIYGKPWQTLCAVKSLLKHSGHAIDKIYLTIEKHHPYDDDPSWILNMFDNIHFTPRDYYFTKGTCGDLNNQQERFVYRYQFGIESSDKDFVFIMHNDILFTGDIVVNMLNEITKANEILHSDYFTKAAGIGLVGQCWNCPAFKSGNCDGDRHDKVNYSWDDVMHMFVTHPPARHQLEHINKEKPMPLPECRLNEFACIIDRNVSMHECYPSWNTPLFGSYDMLDLGDAWFRSLIDKGYKFINYDINKDSDHGYFSKIESRNYNSDKNFFVSGYPTQLNEQKYWEAEHAAMEYFKTNFV